MSNQRQPRQEDPKHLALIRQCPCICCGRSPSEAAHVRMSDHARGKPITGMRQKPDDRWTVPLCHRDHMHQHTRGERVYWEAHGLDPIDIAIQLYAATGDVDAMTAIVRSVR